MNPSLKRLFIAAALLAVTWVETQGVWRMHRLPELARLSEDVARGHAPWRVYQNRILGPYAIHALSRLPGATAMGAYQLFGVLALWVSNLVAFHVGSVMLASRRGGWELAVANILVFLFLANSTWLYPWDFIDSVTMLLAAYFIWRNAPISWFVALFALELLNRESASFIALWLLLDGAARMLASRTWRQDLGRLITGIALIAFGAGWTAMVRSRLLKWDAPDGQTQRLVFGGQHFHLADNLRTLAHPAVADSPKVWALLAVFVLAMAWALYRRLPRAVPISLLIASLLTSSFLIAFLDEMRIWIAIVPFLLPLLAGARAVPAGGTPLPTSGQGEGATDV